MLSLLSDWSSLNALNHYRTNTTYFLTEGKTNLSECLRLSFKRAVSSGIEVIVMYTANGEGLELACTKYLAEAAFSQIRVVGVSLPIGSVPNEALSVPPTRLELL